MQYWPIINTEFFFNFKLSRFCVCYINTGGTDWKKTLFTKTTQSAYLRTIWHNYWHVMIPGVTCTIGYVCGCKWICTKTAWMINSSTPSPPYKGCVELWIHKMHTQILIFIKVFKIVQLSELTCGCCVRTGDVHSCADVVDLQTWKSNDNSIYNRLVPRTA